MERLPAAEPDTDRQEGIYPSGSDGAVPGHLFESDGSASGRPCDVDYSDYYLIYRATEVYYCRCNAWRSKRIIVLGRKSRAGNLKKCRALSFFE